MSISSPWVRLNSNGVASVPNKEGVYELADNARTRIYIRRSNDLNRRLHDHQNTTDACLRAAESFRYELTSSSERRERELLDEFYQQFRRYPRCNDRRG